jgi:hypothetical protein
MRRNVQLLMLALSAGALSACNDLKEYVLTENIPTAGVRFINAVPDTNAMDFRFIDKVESNAHFRIAFRNNAVATTGAAGTVASTQIQYKGAQAGARRFRIFLNDTTQAVASTFLKDSTVNLEAGKLYTVIMMGNARSTVAAERMRMVVLEENPNPPTGQVALRVINATTSAIEGRHYVSGGAPGATANWTVPALSVSPFVNTAAGTIFYNIRAAGSATALFTDVRAIMGAAEVTGPPGPFDAQPGTTVAGSAVTGIVFPRSTAGSKAPQTAAFAVPAISFMWDKRPPRTI